MHGCLGYLSGPRAEADEGAGCLGAWSGGFHVGEERLGLRGQRPNASPALVLGRDSHPDSTVRGAGEMIHMQTSGTPTMDMDSVGWGVQIGPWWCLAWSSECFALVRGWPHIQKSCVILAYLFSLPEP